MDLRTPLRQPEEIEDEIFVITGYAHETSDLSALSYAEQRLHEIGRYVSDRSADYMIKHPEFIEYISRMIRIGRHHIFECCRDILGETV